MAEFSKGAIPHISFTKKEVLWNNQAVTIGGTTAVVDVRNTNSIGVFILVSAVGSVTLEMQTSWGFFDRQVIDFVAGQPNFQFLTFVNGFPFEFIRLKSNTIFTVSAEIVKKY